MTESAVEAPQPGGDENKTDADKSAAPIDLWPEGVLAAAAGAVLLAVAYRHRRYLGKKIRDARSLVEEFHKHGGVEELRQLGSQLLELARGRD